MASIREHSRKDGSKSWYVLWRDPDLGKQTSMSFTTEQQAKNMKSLLDANGQRLSIVERGLQQAATKALTLNELFDRHMKGPLEADEYTKAKYRRMYDGQVKEVLGSIPAEMLTEDDLLDWSDGRYALGNTRKTIMNTTGLLSSAYKRGIRRKWVTHNPFDVFRLPAERRSGRRSTFLTKKEFDLIHAAMPTHYHLFTEFLVNTGLRFSEATALVASDLRLDEEIPIVSVTKAWKGSSSEGFRLGPPKSEESIRDVSITSEMVQKLRPLTEKTGYLFTAVRGDPLRAPNYNKSALTKAVKAAKIAKTPRPHDLRHTHASWLLQEGVSMFVVSRRLGHANIEITTKIYGHITPQGHKEAVAGLERALKR